LGRIFLYMRVSCSGFTASQQSRKVLYWNINEALGQPLDAGRLYPRPNWARLYAQKW
jgi:hypothetical protein